MSKSQKFTVDLYNDFISLVANVPIDELITKAQLFKETGKDTVKLIFACDLTEEDKEFLKQNDFLVKEEK